MANQLMNSAMKLRKKNPLALKHDISTQKKYMDHMSLNSPADCDHALAWCDKQIGLWQRKINGSEISNKADLQKAKSNVEAFRRKVEQKKNSFGSSTESFIDFCSSMEI